MIPYSLAEMPMNTPVFVPRSEEGGSPASSRASQANSSSRRCCGSICAASRSEMPKKWLSNSSIAFEKTAPAGTHLAGHGGVGIVEAIDVPAVWRHLANGIDAVAEQPPIGLWIDRAAGKTAGHADDGDRLGCAAARAHRAGLASPSARGLRVQRRHVFQAFRQWIHA